MNSETSSSARRCLECGAPTSAPVCPTDGMPSVFRAAVARDVETLAPGTIVAGRYRLSTRLGEGAAGIVFAATQLGLEQEVAVKLLRTSDDDESIVRFFREARVMARLRHPNTVRVFDFGQDESGLFYLAMERLSGRSLRALLAAGRVAPELAGRIALEVTRSLVEAHEAGLVHRDLKPENVFLHEVAGEQVVKVLDFGIARLHGSSLTNASQIPCTPEYASPEQAIGEPSDARSDVYSLGVVLYELLAGAVPFTGPNSLAILYKHAKKPVPELPADLTGPLVARLAAVVRTATKKRASDRYESAAALRDALVEALGAVVPATLPRVESVTSPGGELPLEPTEVSAEPTEVRTAMADAEVPTEVPTVAVAPSAEPISRLRLAPPRPAWPRAAVAALAVAALAGLVYAARVVPRAEVVLPVEAPKISAPAPAAAPSPVVAPPSSAPPSAEAKAAEAPPSPSRRPRPSIRPAGRPPAKPEAAPRGAVEREPPPAAGAPAPDLLEVEVDDLEPDGR